MKEIDTDILIIGSGLVGLVAAHSLSSLKYKVTVVDKKNLLDQAKVLKDNRTVAISEGSKRFLESLSLWAFLKPHAEPIKNIKVYDRSPENKIIFKNEDKNKNLGYVIENNTFSKILINKLQEFNNSSVLFGHDLKKIEIEENSGKTYFEKTKIQSKLIIAADGKNSTTKKMVGNKTYKKKYSENALVLNFLHKKSLNHTAYEIFYDSGPLAILPMKSDNKKCKSTIIWSNKPDLLNKLKNSDHKFVKNFVEERLEKIVGKVEKINSMQLFPLSAHINDSFINNRLIYIGDSAHSIHPIAGQGWNLGVNDVKNLHKICKRFAEDIGSVSFCKKYNELSYNKAYQLYQITDKLNSHFKKNRNLYRLFSNLSFSLIDNNYFLKNKITKYAMGV